MPCCVAALMGVAAMMVLVPLPAVAQTAGPNAVNPQAAKKLTPEAARELYEQRRRDLKAVDEQRRSISRDVDETAFERAQLNSRLIERAQALQQAEQHLSSIEDQVFELRAKEQLKRMELGSKRAELTRILTILQRLGRQPPPVLVTERDDALAMVRSGMLLAYSYRTVKPLADKLSGDLLELRELSGKLASEQKKQLAAEDELKRERSEIETALKAKADTLKVNQAKLDDLKRIAMNYAQTINTLADVTGNLDRVVAEKTGLGLYEAELSRSAGVELKPDAKKIAFVQPGRLAPGIPFGQAKGMLPLPAQGRRLRNFGTADTYGGTAKGILIETRAAAQITAPCDGWVTFAHNLKNYGRVLIINAGGGYHVVLAGMDAIQVNIGQFVLAGEPVATMAAPELPGQSSGPPAKPSLYVEFRKDQRPIDPDPWWSSRVEKG